MANKDANTGIAKRIVPVFNDDLLRDMGSFAELDKYFEAAGVNVENFAEYGTGFTVLKNLDALCDVPLVFVQWREADGDFGTFVVAHVITQHGAKYVIPNGSVKSGLAAQLLSVTSARLRRGANESAARAGLFAPNGLVRSSYDYTDADGKTHPAVTYYIAE